MSWSELTDANEAFEDVPLCDSSDESVGDTVEGEGNPSERSSRVTLSTGNVSGLLLLAAILQLLARMIWEYVLST